MPKDKLTDYSATNASNTDIGGINIDEGMLPSAVNNSIRELMTHQKEAFGSGTPLYVDQTNNRVGVGTTSPTRDISIVGTSTSYINLIGSTTSGIGMLLGDTDAEIRGAFIYDNNADRINLRAGGNTTRVSIDSDGLKFGSDTAAANALDDYEESTYSFAERQGQATITTHRCRVVKIGALVYIDGSFTVGSNSNSNHLNINLPFASTSGTNGIGGGSIGFSNLSTSIIEAALRPNVENLADNLFFRYGSNNIVTCSAASGKRIDFNVWYPVL